MRNDVLPLREGPRWLGGAAVVALLVTCGSPAPKGSGGTAGAGGSASSGAAGANAGSTGAAGVGKSDAGVDVPVGGGTGGVSPDGSAGGMTSAGTAGASMSGGAGTTTTPPAASVITQHNDLGRTGLNPNETILSPTNVDAAHF
ncbi:MAG TPA: hypothetical protein VK989_13480, partial [Polyangia bacterium]|nr:hypothetical protein [Polyangia bacterium]